MQTTFLALAQLCEKLETMSKRSLMVSLVAEFLKRLHDDEVEPAISLILGRPFPRGDQSTLKVNWATLSGLIKRLANVDWKSFMNAFSKTGDMGSATKIIFEASQIPSQSTLFKKPLTILKMRHSLEANANHISN